MKKVSDQLLCELNILRNRLEAGESILQCLQSMGTALRAPPEFFKKWDQLCKLMLEGRVLPGKAVADLTRQLEKEKRLQELVAQKTLSPRIQAILSLALVIALLMASWLLFPPELQPNWPTLGLSAGLCTASGCLMHLILERIKTSLIYLEWISFQRSVCLALQCGISFEVAVSENRPVSSVFSRWPPNLRLAIDGRSASSATRPDLLWDLGLRVWQTIRNHYDRGLPLANLLERLANVQEEAFTTWVTKRAEQTGNLLLAPLFLLSVPAVLILLFVPLLRALQI